MPNQRNRNLLLGAILVLVPLLLYGVTLGYPFLNYDDSTHLLNNPSIREWSSIPKFFGTDIWRNTDIGQGAYYRPLPMVFIVLRYKLFGFDPKVWHGSSVALNILFVLLLWRFVRKLTDNNFLGFAVALLFALHPMVVESVAWISGISELLLGIFVVGAMLAFLHWRDKPTLGRQAAYVVLSFAGLLCKETAAAVPVLIGIYQLLWPIDKEMPGRARVKSLMQATWPLVMMLAVYTGMRMFAMHNVVHLAGNTTRDVILTTPLLLVLYLKQMLWPLRLALFYDAEIVAAPSLRWFVLPLIAVVLFVGWTVWAFRKQKFLGFLSAWWFAFLGPALVGLYTFPSRDIFHDRYGYLSVIALLIALMWLLSKVPSSSGVFGQPAISVFVLIIVSAALGLLSIRQVKTWSSDYALFRQAVEVAPNNIRARNLYSNQLLKRGKTQEALRMYEGTLALAPDAWETNFAIGYTLATAGRLDESETFLRKSVQLDPRETVGYVVLAEVLRAGGKRDAALNLLESGMNVAYNRVPLQEKMKELQGTVSIGR